MIFIPPSKFVLSLMWPHASIVMSKSSGGLMMQRRELADSKNLDQRWRPALMAFFLRRVGNHAEAEDMTQETLLRVLRRAPDSEQSDSYVFQIAQNLLIDRSRRRQVREAHQALMLGDMDRETNFHDPERIAEGRIQIEHVVEVLRGLPERTRTIFILYRLENLPQDTIGQAFGISASAVKQQVAKVMALLAKHVRGERR